MRKMRRKKRVISEMFFADNTAEKSMLDAQSLLERAASRSMNQSMTLLPDEIQQVPTRIPPFNEQEAHKEGYIANSISTTALEESKSVLDSTLTKFRSQVREGPLIDQSENNSKEKFVGGSSKANAMTSVATSPLKSISAPNPSNILNAVRFIL